MSKENQDIEEEIKKATGNNPVAEKKIEWLKTKWKSERYKKAGEEATMMHNILFMPCQPIHAAVLSDNVQYFKQNYQFNWETVDLFLTEACLCGSRHIAEYLLKELKFGFKERPDLLACITASMNTTWAKEVAQMLAQQNVPMTKHIFRLANGPLVTEIVNIFKNVASQKAGEASQKPSAESTANTLAFSKDNQSSAAAAGAGAAAASTAQKSPKQPSAQ